MARSISDTSTPSKGHNKPPMTEEDIEALQLHYTLRIRREIKAAEAKKAEYEALRSDVNGTFSLIKGDLHIPRKKFEELLALQDMDESEFVAHEADRQRLMARQGLPVGTQLSLDLTGDTVDDKRLAYLDGQRAGHRADDPAPPEKIAPYLHPDWLDGWHQGQAENALKLNRANEILEERSMSSDDDEDADDTSDRDEDEAFDPDAEASELKASGFMEREGDDEFGVKAAEVFPGDEAAEAIDRKAAGRARRQKELAH